MPIYTRTGDAGTTSLFGGKRVLKCEELVDAYGSMDELNSWVGLVVSETAADHLKKLFDDIQSDLFSIGGALAGWSTDLAMLDTRVTQMEVEIDAMEKELSSLTNFILPGGTASAAHVHIARSITRRVERQVVALAQKPASTRGESTRGGQKVDSSIIKYLNRLSDLFFMLARFINNKANVAEVVWSSIPRKTKSRQAGKSE